MPGRQLTKSWISGDKTLPAYNIYTNLPEHNQYQGIITSEPRTLNLEPIILYQIKTLIQNEDHNVNSAISLKSAGNKEPVFLHHK